MSIAAAIREAVLSDDADQLMNDEMLNRILSVFMQKGDWLATYTQAMTFALFVAEALDGGETARADRYHDALTWALGSNGDFRVRFDGEGAYWWRRELQARAGLEWNGLQFVDGDASWLTRGVASNAPPLLDQSQTKSTSK